MLLIAAVAVLLLTFIEVILYITLSPIAASIISSSDIVDI